MPWHPPKAPLYLTALFAFLGFADAAYLTASHYFTLPLPCSLTEGCDIVLRSRYAMIGPVPLAALGAAYYLLALFLAIFLYTQEKPDLRPARAIWLLSGLGVLASGYLFYLQSSVIHAFCMYCLGSALTSILLFAASSVLVGKMSRTAKAAEPAAQK